jgi:hypothetical protein
VKIVKLEIPFFLCHVPQDEDFAKRIAKAFEVWSEIENVTFKVWTDEKKVLRGKGIYKPWIDESEILIGRKTEGIDEFVKFSIVLLSKNSIESNWVKNELSSALDLEFGNGLTLPVRIDICEIPSSLESRLLADFGRANSDDEFADEVRQLVDSVVSLWREDHERFLKKLRGGKSRKEYLEDLIESRTEYFEMRDAFFMEREEGLKKELEERGWEDEWMSERIAENEGKRARQDERDKKFYDREIEKRGRVQKKLEKMASKLSNEEVEKRKEEERSRQKEWEKKWKERLEKTAKKQKKWERQVQDQIALRTRREEFLKERLKETQKALKELRRDHTADMKRWKEKLIGYQR